MGDRLVIGGQLGDYLIDSVVGRGGMSVVYRAKHSRLGMLVALKVLAPELSADDSFRERFLREAQMAASMDHPNVIPIHDMGLHEDSLYIILRYVPGGDLKTLLSASGPLSLTRALALLTPVAAALDAAHVRGLIHRDVKPANILIQRADGVADEHVYLTDFGIAKSVSDDIGLTKSGVSVGTLGYMAPEQIEGKSVSAQTDVYALAATLYECLTGRVPFRRELSEGVRPTADDLESVSALRADLPPTLDAVLRKALARDPDERYTTCNEFMRSCWMTLGDQVAPAAAAPVAAEATQPSADAAEGAAAAAVAAPVAVVAADQVAPPPPHGAPATDAEPPAAGGGAPRDQRGRKTKRRGRVLIGLGTAVVVVGVAIAAALIAAGSSSAGKSATASLGAVPTNHVSGDGNASVSLSGNRAVVTVNTTNLDRNAPLVHLMHIHAGAKGVCPPAAAAQLHNGHLTISTTNGAAFYGPPVQSLTTNGDTSAASILAFPRYLSGGTLHYVRTIALPPEVAAEIRRSNAVIVVHGVDYDGSGIYSGVLGISELGKGVPGTATAPALCGKLVASTSNGSASARANNGVLRYTASLKPSAESLSEILYCISYLREAASEEARRRGRAGSNLPPSA
jgi:hypothetical protein